MLSPPFQLRRAKLLSRFSPSVDKKVRRWAERARRARKAQGDFFSGRTIQHVRELGSGVQGQVSLYLDEKTNEYFAVKHFFEQDFRGASNEIKSIMHLQPYAHPRICNAIYARDANDRDPIIVFPYYQNGDLHRYVQQRFPHSAVPLKFMRHVFVQLIEALAFIHHGVPLGSTEPPTSWIPVIHCDIGARNILVTDSVSTTSGYPDIVLGDLGCAHVGASSGFTSFDTDLRGVADIIFRMRAWGRGPLPLLRPFRSRDERTQERMLNVWLGRASDGSCTAVELLREIKIVMGVIDDKMYADGVVGMVRRA